MAKLCYKIADISQIKYTPEEDEIIMDRETKNLFIFKDGEWKYISFQSTQPQMSLYELNKQLINQAPILIQEELENKAIEICNWMEETLNTNFMLYGKEISYFSLFKRVYGYALNAEKICETLKAIGDVRSIEITEDRTGVEIWVLTKEGKNTCLYLFPYDTGVIEI